MTEAAPQTDPIEPVAPTPDPEPERREPPRGRSRLLVVGMAALGLFVAWLAWQTVQLQSQNQALETQVQGLEAQLSAHQDHLAGARERAGSLRTQMDELEAFLAQDPTAAE